MVKRTVGRSSREDNQPEGTAKADVEGGKEPGCVQSADRYKVSLEAPLSAWHLTTQPSLRLKTCP